jgi:hypothetical protein
MEKHRINAKETWNRREFLGATLTATAAMTAARPLTARAETAAAAPPAAAGKQPPLPFNPRTAAAMPMRNLGRTGFRASRTCCAR